MELTIEVRGQEVASKEKITGSSVVGKVSFDPLEKATLKFFQDMLAENRIEKPEHLELLGKRLYRVLFDENVSGHYQRCLDEAKRKNVEHFKVKLSFMDKTSDLVNLPWEYLYYPGDTGYFLATKVDLTLSRYIQLNWMPASEPEAQPLKVLVLQSQPLGLSSKTPEMVHSVMEKLKRENGIEVEYLIKPTLDNLESEIEKTKPHVLHFIGSGRVKRNERKSDNTGIGELALVNEVTEAIEWCPAQMFADLVKDKGVRVVFLELSMRSEQSSEIDDQYYESFSEMAKPLVMEKIQAVVAMQFPIEDSHARRFVEVFYQNLATGTAVDKAVQNGRTRMHRMSGSSYNSPIFGTPMLFAYKEDNIVIPKEKSSQNESLASSPRDVKNSDIQKFFHSDEGQKFLIEQLKNSRGGTDDK